MRFLTVPGYTGSGPDHWQTHLENTYEGFSRVVQDDWETVDRDRWVARLDEAVRAVDGEVFLVGHSCGSVTVAQWAATCHDARVTGALLVAPADVEAPARRGPSAARRPCPPPYCRCRSTWWSPTTTRTCRGSAARRSRTRGAPPSRSSPAAATWPPGTATAPGTTWRP